MSETSEKFKIFWKTNFGRKLWKKNTINGTPDIWPGILGLGVVLFMWARNILSFNGKNKVAVGF